MSRPATLKKFEPFCNGTRAVQLVTVVQVTDHRTPLIEMVAMPGGAVPVMMAAPLLTVMLPLTLKAGETVASWFCRNARRWSNQVLTASGGASGWLSHQVMPLATSEAYLASMTGLQFVAAIGPLSAFSMARQ